MSHLVLFICLFSCFTLKAQDQSGVQHVGHIYNHWDQINHIEFYGDYCLIAAGISGLQILDVSDHANPTWVGSFSHLRARAKDLTAVNDFVYLTDGAGIYIINVSDPADPMEVSFLETDEWTTALAVSGDYLYHIDEYGFHVVDISDPENPFETGSDHTPDYTSDLVVEGEYAYLASKLDMIVMNISNPEDPVVTSSLRFEGARIGHIELYEGQLYCGGDGYFYSIDVSDPENPEIAGLYEGIQYISGIQMHAGHAFVSGFGGKIEILDISVPENIEPINGIETDYLMQSMGVDGDYIFVGEPTNHLNQDGGLHIFRYNLWERIDEINSLDREGFVFDAAIRDNYAFVASWDGGMRVVDIVDPTEPLEVGNFASDGLTRGITLEGDIAYLAEHGGGLVAVDISDPDDPNELGRIDFEREEFYQVDVVEDYAYVACGENGLKIIDVSQPNEMVTTGREHIGEYALDVVVSGDHAYLAIEQLGLALINISDPSRPQLIEIFGMENGGGEGMAMRDNLIYLAAENSGLFIIDVADPNSPQEVGHIVTPGYARDVTLAGDYALIADADKGLRVIDISEPSDPVEVGFYDTPGWAEGVVCDGTIAFVSDYSNLGIYDFSEAMNITGYDQFSPLTVTLIEAFPNPFNGTVNLRYGLPSESYISLSLFNPLGQNVKTVYNGRKPAGDFMTTFNARDLPAGLYYARLTTPDAAVTQKITLVR